jgi:putative hydrolase of the HAD superfamily
MMSDHLYIFDMGGVVSVNTDVFPEIFRRLQMSEATFMSLAGDNLEKLLNGAISTDEFWGRFSVKYGKPIEEDLFAKFFKPKLNPGTVAIVRGLKGHSRVVCGTNTFDPHYACHLRLGDYDIFDAVYASNRIGLSKPNPEFFTYILEKEGFRPEQAFFVDDTEQHVLAAKQLGIRAIHFKSAEVLSRELDRLNAR